jgi:hypothetical protein
MSPYRTIFDVSDRIPDIWLGAAALVILIIVILAGIWDVDGLLARWPLVLAPAAALVATEGVVDQLRIIVLGSLLVAVLIAAAERYVIPMPTSNRRKAPSPGAAGLLVGTFMLIFAAGSGLSKIPVMWLGPQLAQGQADIIEGVVAVDFEAGGGRTECISVDARRFCYADSSNDPGFNRTRALGGPMRDGLQVRISSIGQTIVRVEVSDPAG